jgi:pimeloyl-ACP methyl ester carboxylesterase
VALHAAARRPEKWRGLVLISPLVFQPPPPPGLRLAKKHPRVMRLFFESAPGRLLVSRLLRRAVYALDGLQARSAARHLLDTLDAPGGWEAATRIGLQAHDQSPGPEILSRVTLPCLVIWGSRDRSHAPELGEKLIRSLAGPSRLVILPGLGHNCHEEDPETFLRLVKEFWQEVEISGSPDTYRRIPSGGRSTRQTC